MPRTDIVEAAELSARKAAIALLRFQCVTRDEMARRASYVLHDAHGHAILDRIGEGDRDLFIALLGASEG